MLDPRDRTAPPGEGTAPVTPPPARREKIGFGLFAETYRRHWADAHPEMTPRHAPEPRQESAPLPAAPPRDTDRPNTADTPLDARPPESAGGST
jgi:hypothetical protein